TTECCPTGSVDVTNCASSTPPTTDSATGVCACPSMVKVAVPVGVPANPDAVTIAVKVTGWPTVEGSADEPNVVAVAVRSGLYRASPILLAPHSVNQRLPSGPTVIPFGELWSVGVRYSVIAWVVGLIMPMWLSPPSSSVNHTLPPGPAAIPVGSPSAVGIW